MNNSKGIVLTNIDCVPGKEIIEQYGLVLASDVCSSQFGDKDFMSDLTKHLKGEFDSAEGLDKSRIKITEKMIFQAKKKGANAVISIRYSVLFIKQGTVKMSVSGTAVTVE